MPRVSRPIPLARWAVVLALAAAACGGDADFERAARANTSVAWDDYLRAHPDGAHAREARERRTALVEATEWQRARSADTADAYRRYLRGYPQGAHAPEALIAITNLNLVATPATEAPVEPTAAGPKPAAGTITRSPVVAPPPPTAGDGAPATAASAAVPGKPAAPRKRAPAAAADSPVPPPAPPAADGFRVQLGAFGDGSAAAERAWRDLTARHPELGGRTPLIAAARAANGRAIYRLQLAGLDRASAETLCAGLVAHGDPCVLVAPLRTPAAAAR